VSSVSEQTQDPCGFLSFDAESELARAIDTLSLRVAQSGGVWHDPGNECCPGKDGSNSGAGGPAEKWERLPITSDNTH